PCIDSGHSADVQIDLLTDIDGEPCIHGAAVDIGADEYYEPDSNPPETFITQGPGNDSTQCNNPVLVEFSGLDNRTPVDRLVYSWKIDDGEWSGWASTNSVNLTLGHGPHMFQVKSRDESGQEDETPAVRTFRMDLEPPTVLNLAANPAMTSAVITWQTDEPATSQVEYGKTDAYGSYSPLNADLRTSHTVYLAGLEAAVTYHYRVICRDACGHEAVSADFTFTTFPDTQAPDTAITSGPENGGVVCSDSVSFTFTGTDNYTPPAALKYRWKVDEGAWSADSSATTAEIAGLADGSHTFRVAAVDGAGNADPTPATRNFYIAASPPVMTDVAAAPSQGEVVITWTTSIPTTSQVEYGEDEGYGNTTELDANKVISHRVTITGLQPNTTYHYRAKSSDVCGREVTSGDQTFTTPAIPNLTGSILAFPPVAYSGLRTSLKWQVTNTGQHRHRGYDEALGGYGLPLRRRIRGSRHRAH
ncbi:MAG: fibronectin type III domain-containing protein, partial [Armatimonadota bacterium]